MAKSPINLQGFGEGVGLNLPAIVVLPKVAAPYSTVRGFLKATRIA